MSLVVPSTAGNSALNSGLTYDRIHTLTRSLLLTASKIYTYSLLPGEGSKPLESKTQGCQGSQGH